MQPYMLHIGLCASLFVNCLPNCADETRTPVVKIPSIADETPVVVVSAARREPELPLDEACVEHGVNNTLQAVDVIVPEFDLAHRSFVSSNARLQIVSARAWTPDLALRIGWIFGRIVVFRPNEPLRSFIGSMGRSKKEVDAGAGDVVLPAWIEKRGAWVSDPIAVIVYRTGIAAALLPMTGGLEDLEANASGQPPTDLAELLSLDEFRSFQLLDQKWMSSALPIVDLVLSDYAGVVTFAPYAVELRDVDGSLGCASVFNRR